MRIETCIKSLIALLISLLLLSCNSSDSSIEEDGDNGGNLTDGDSERGDSPVDLDGDETSVDGDFSGDEEWSDNIVSCEGACLDDVPAACINNQLCVCDRSSDTLKEILCNDVCNESGLGSSSGCGYNTDFGGYNCICEIPYKQCNADYVVAGLPFNDSSSTKGQDNDFSMIDSCFDWGVIGPDVVYSIQLQKGNTIEVKVKVLYSSSFDPSLIISDSCSNSATCLKGSDSHWSNESEHLTFTAESSGTYFIIVDSGYNSDVTESSGGFEIEITGEMAALEDGDEDDTIDGDEDLPSEMEEGSQIDGDDELDLEIDNYIDGDEDINPEGEDIIENEIEPPGEYSEIISEDEL